MTGTTPALRSLAAGLFLGWPVLLLTLTPTSVPLFAVGAGLAALQDRARR